MPNRDQRARALITAGKFRTAGRMVVRYRDALGHSQDATVMAAGTVSGLKLRIGRNNLIVDNVPKAATMKDTNSYYVFGVPTTT